MIRSFLTPVRARRLTVLSYAFAACGLASAAVAAVTPHIVSQKGKAFFPNAIAINSGDVLTLVNDDENVVHHAYIEDDRFSYDSGDQDPGSRNQVTFDRKGTFTVLCGIHPKMKLVVEVK